MFLFPLLFPYSYSELFQLLCAHLLIIKYCSAFVIQLLHGLGSCLMNGSLLTSQLLFLLQLTSSLVLLSVSWRTVLFVRRLLFCSKQVPIHYGFLIRSEERRVGKECRSRW